MIECPDCRSQNTDDSKFCKECAAPLQSTDQSAFQETKTIGNIPQKLTLNIGSQIGKYEIIGKLGGGGMGVVFKAKDIRLKRTVALKLLPPELMCDPEYYQRFIQEAQAASMLEHQNICTIHEIDEAIDGQCYIAMSYYEGETIKQRVESGPIPIDKALDIAIQIARGLSKAHTNGIVHRDIKPANVMVMGDGLAVILDFGLAKLSGQTRLTKPATILGTVAYMSPEQASGRDIDLRSDIWSSGAVLYEMLTAHIPFDGDNEQAVIYGIMKRPPIPPTDFNKEIPPDLERITLKCLHKVTTQRYQAADELLSELESLRRSLLFKKHETATQVARRSDIKKDTEQRQATIMLVRISGYAKLREKSDVEEAASLMQSCYEICSSVDEKYGGHINKIEEDTLQFSFGVPQAIENPPRKAVNAALEIRTNLQRFNQREVPEIPLNVRIGINTGRVIVGSIGTGPTPDFFVMGDTVNVASELLDAAQDGQIVVGPLTHKYTRADFRYHALKPLVLEDTDSAIPIHELLTVKQKIHRPEPSEERIVQSEMVGRDQEFGSVLSHIQKAINHEGSILSVIGEAGIGKSRLIAELKQKADRQQVNLLEGRAISIGKNLSFYPLIDALKNWARIQEQDGPTESFQKLEAAILEAYPEGVAETLPFIATLMGMSLPPAYEDRVKGLAGEALEKLILVSLRKLIIKAAEQKPLVFILEDLHWADTTSIEMLKALFRVAEEHPVLFINVFRPGYEETSERLLKSVRARYYHMHEEIRLGLLDESHSEELLQNLLKIKGFPSPLMKRIASITGGNPFFIEEIVRSLIDQGAVELKDGGFQVSARIDQVEIPSTIDDVLMSRIDRLDEETRMLLKVASVIGRNFFYKILVDVADTVVDVAGKLAFLKSVQLILERKRMQELEYLFKHTLAQEATYKSILTKQRKALHLKIADSIRDVFAVRLAEFYGMLSYHYTRGEDLEKAEEFLIKSGEEAMKASASSEALNYYQDALDIYLRLCGENTDPGKIARLEKNIALAYYNKGQYQEAVESYDRVQPHYWMKLPTSKAGTILKFLNSFVHMLIGLYLPALKWRRTPTQKDHDIVNLFYIKCLAMGHVDPKRVFIESLYLIKRMTRVDLRQLENGIPIFAGASLAFSWTGMSFMLARKILEFIKDKIDKDDVKTTIYYQTDDQTLNFFVGEWERQRFDDDLVDLGIRVAEIFSISNYTIFHGRTFLEQGKFKKAMYAANRLQEMSVLFEHDYPMALKYFLKTKLLFKYRKLPEAVKEAEEGIVFNKKTRLGTLLLGLYSLKARMMILVRDIEAAEEMLAQAEKVMAEMNVTPCYLSEYLLSKLSLEMFNLEEAVNGGNGARMAVLGLKALRTAKKTVKNAAKVASDQVEAHRLLGACYWLTGNQKKALKSWERSIVKGKKLGACLELARTYHTIGPSYDRTICPEHKYRAQTDRRREICGSYNRSG
jgi:serine/threonine protein kinase/tetratricopeptide (TPR) repeat protein/type II secretory pathway predicted ATPase ExeA